MRAYFLLAATLALGTVVVVASAPSKAQPYGPGMMGGYGSNGYGPGMMYGYGPNGERYYGRGGQSYRGKRRCWHQTGSDRDQGYYERCRD